MLNDLRYALRLLYRSPGFTAAAVLTLAFGIGATTAIFTTVEAILLRPLPIADPQRVVTLHVQEPDSLSRTFTYPTFLRYREQAAQVFQAIGGSGRRGFRVSVGTDTRLASAAFVTGEYFEMAGVRPARGRSRSARGRTLCASPRCSEWWSHLSCSWAAPISPV